MFRKVCLLMGGDLLLMVKFKKPCDHKAGRVIQHSRATEGGNVIFYFGPTPFFFCFLRSMEVGVVSVFAVAKGSVLGESSSPCNA